MQVVRARVFRTEKVSCFSNLSSSEIWAGTVQRTLSVRISRIIWRTKRPKPRHFLMADHIVVDIVSVLFAVTHGRCGL
jgi:hypothetical protein